MNRYKMKNHQTHTQTTQYFSDSNTLNQNIHLLLLLVK